ncbi:Ribosomal protein S13, mitochondrial [Sesamum angolense]|uniref:Ribosomal protein S13, mitochondrial n=1 Tax=Sesamum angolense TaxID=2727404 RepID=A0AAE1TA04_9LAMI|nr:Ribosomal protein S13, mitochondrial [Sesamum angolense]
MIGQDHVVHWELKRGERADIERLISISCYRGIRHQDGSPLRVNELILMLGLVASKFGNERSLPKALGLLRHDISGLALRPPIVSARLRPRSYCFRLSRHER